MDHYMLFRLYSIDRSGQHRSCACVVCTYGITVAADTATAPAPAHPTSIQCMISVTEGD